MPAYWAVLTVAAIVPGMAGDLQRELVGVLRAAQSYPVYDATGTCAVDPYRCGIPIAWSLSIEVFFYLTLPLFVLAMAGSAGGGGAVAALELSAVACSARCRSHPELRPRRRPPHVAVLLAARPGLVVRLGLGLAAISVKLAAAPSEPAFVTGSGGTRAPPCSPGSCCTVGRRYIWFDGRPPLVLPGGRPR